MKNTEKEGGTGRCECTIKRGGKKQQPGLLVRVTSSSLCQLAEPWWIFFSLLFSDVRCQDWQSSRRIHTLFPQDKFCASQIIHCATPHPSLPQTSLEWWLFGHKGYEDLYSYEDPKSDTRSLKKIQTFKSLLKLLNGTMGLVGRQLSKKKKKKPAYDAVEGVKRWEAKGFIYQTLD